MDVERAHRRVDGEELAHPTENLEETGQRRRGRKPHHPEAVTRELHDLPHRTETLIHPRHVMVPRAYHRDREKRDSQDHDGDEARYGPAGNGCRQGDVQDEPDHGDEVEDAMREHRPQQARPRTSLRQAPVERARILPPWPRWLSAELARRPRRRCRC